MLITLILGEDMREEKIAIDNNEKKLELLKAKYDIPRNFSSTKIVCTHLAPLSHGLLLSVLGAGGELREIPLN